MPTQESELWEHQKDCIAQALSLTAQNKSVIVPLPPGAGKSRIVIEVIKHVINNSPTSKILIVGNRRLLLDLVWRAEINKWAPAISNKIVSIDGRREPSTRKSFWRNIKQSTNNIVIATPQILKRDWESKLLEINNFDLIILDEAHHSISKTEADYKISKDYEFITAYKNPVIGITIKDNLSIPEKVIATAKLLSADIVTSESARERDLERLVIKINDEKRLTIEQLLNGEIGRLIAIFKSRYPQVTTFPFGSIDKIIKFYKINSAKDQMLARQLNSQYYKIEIVRRYIDEDNISYIKNERITDSLSIAEKLKQALEGYEQSKLRAIIETTKEEVIAQRPVLIFTNFTDTTRLLYKRLIADGVKTEVLIGGIYDYPAAKLKEFIRAKIQVLVATQDMCGEGLNLQYFRTVILTTGVKSDFKRLNLEGRIRGGKLIQFVYENTKEEKGAIAIPQQITEPHECNVGFFTILYRWILIFLLSIYNSIVCVALKLKALLYKYKTSKVSL